APSARLERLGEHVRLRPRGRFVLTDHELALAGARPDQLVQIVLDTAAGEVRDAVDEQGEPALPHGAGLDRLPQLSGELADGLRVRRLDVPDGQARQRRAARGEAD